MDLLGEYQKSQELRMVNLLFEKTFLGIIKILKNKRKIFFLLAEIKIKKKNKI